MGQAHIEYSGAAVRAVPVPYMHLINQFTARTNSSAPGRCRKLAYCYDFYIPYLVTWLLILVADFKAILPRFGDLRKVESHSIFSPTLCCHVLALDEAFFVSTDLLLLCVGRGQHRITRKAVGPAHNFQVSGSLHLSCHWCHGSHSQLS